MKKLLASRFFPLQLKRCVSTTNPWIGDRFKTKLKSLSLVVLGGSVAFAGVNLYLSNEKFYRQFVIPVAHCFDPETAHSLAVKMIKNGWLPNARYKDPPSLKSQLWNMNFPNPVGLAAGFDKHGEALAGLQRLGFGFVEIGSVTPLPQEGNQQPRLFRLAEDEAVINRYGFNSEGHDVVFGRLQMFKQSEDQREIVGVNLGKNRNTVDAVGDYVKGIKKFGVLADYVVINVSSPNTPGLRALQGRKNLEGLIDEVLKARNDLPKHEQPVILIKIAPDVTKEEMKDIATVVLRKNKRVDGLIISNTTVHRLPTLKSSSRDEKGGLSGKPLKDLSTQVISDMYQLTEGKLPIVGVGGIASGSDAYEKIRAGASLVQIYSALVYQGFPVVTRIKRELQELLAKDGFACVSDAVGIEHHKKEISIS